jgi:hypothetical protein
MREIRTYGLNEGLLARALRTAGWGLLHHGRVVMRRSVVEMARTVGSNTVVDGRATGPDPRRKQAWARSPGTARGSRTATSQTRR